MSTTKYAYELTWDELKKVAATGAAVTTLDGYMLCSRDRKLDTYSGFYKWKEDVARAVATRKIGAVLTAGSRPLNKIKNRRGEYGKLTWSFSSINEFDTCPAQYAAKRYYGTVKDDTNYAAQWGTRVHTAMEHRLGKKKPLDQEFSPYEKYAVALEQVAADGTIVVEQQVAINEKFEQVDWFASDAWGRAVVDVAITSGDKKHIGIYDWKSGKVKDNPLQLSIFAAFASILNPDAEKFKTNYIWLAHDTITGTDYSATDIPVIWGQVCDKVKRIEEAWVTENFVCRPSGLCRGWCPVTNCEHWKPKR